MLWKTSLQPVLNCCPVLDVSASILYLHTASALGTTGFPSPREVEAPRRETDREQEWGRNNCSVCSSEHAYWSNLLVHACWSICVGVRSIVVGDYNTKNPNSQIKSRSMLCCGCCNLFSYFQQMTQTWYILTHNGITDRVHHDGDYRGQS